MAECIFVCSLGNVPWRRSTLTLRHTRRPNRSFSLAEPGRSWVSGPSSTRSALQDVLCHGNLCGCLALNQGGQDLKAKSYAHKDANAGYQRSPKRPCAITLLSVASASARQWADARAPPPRSSIHCAAFRRINATLPLFPLSPFATASALPVRQCCLLPCLPLLHPCRSPLLPSPPFAALFRLPHLPLLNMASVPLPALRRLPPLPLQLESALAASCCCFHHRCLRLFCRFHHRHGCLCCML